MRLHSGQLGRLKHSLPPQPDSSVQRPSGKWGHSLSYGKSNACSYQKSVHQKGLIFCFLCGGDSKASTVLQLRNHLRGLKLLVILLASELQLPFLIPKVRSQYWKLVCLSPAGVCSFYKVCTLADLNEDDFG